MLTSFNLQLAIATLAMTLLPTNSSQAADLSTDPLQINYPNARRAEQTDDYHGTKVADPFRWLEDLDSEETRAWVEAENKVTEQFLAKIPSRDAIRKRLTALWDFPKYGIPRTDGGRYFFTKNDGLQNQSVLYWAAGPEAEPTVLLDPNTLTKDGTVALSGYDISENGQMMAYGLAAAGSDWEDWKVRDVATGKDLSDELRWVKFSGASWTPDNKGFFYSRYDEPKEDTKFVDTNYYQKLYYHRVGTSQSEDRLVYERADKKEWQFHGTATEDGKYLVISVHRGTEQKNAIFYQRLDKPDAKVVELLPDFDSKYTYLGNDGTLFWFRTNLGAPRGKVIAIDLDRPARDNWKELVPESKDLLQSAAVVGNKFFLEYLEDAHSLVKVCDLAGKSMKKIDLPGLGTAVGFGGRRTDTETFYAFTSFTSPATIYRYDLASGKSTLYRQPKVDFDPSRYETKQVFYTSRDGTRVPMFISHKKGLEQNGENPTLLYGYGGFNASLTPMFSVSNLVWMEMGGVYAVPNLRGGGEYGREWHEAGTKARKQNVFDDFIAAAEYLIKEKYTSSKKLAIKGGSNGGLLVGACLTQRPDLFGAALPAVGVMDMLRYHKFTIGWAWVSDYGSADNAGEFKSLYAYSPLHNIKPGIQYPPTLVTTADHDDRVVPGHSYKFAATLQGAQSGRNPVLIRIETRAGHGAGKPTTKIIDEATDQLAFLVETLKVKLPERFE
jgi:prolyl oligopeptidase